MYFSHQKNTVSCTFAVDFAEEKQLVHVGIKAARRHSDLFKLFRGNPAFSTAKQSSLERMNPKAM
jgi:hypothetical protein